MFNHGNRRLVRQHREMLGEPAKNFPFGFIAIAKLALSSSLLHQLDR
ncbi:hypothetical protein ABIC08_009313 [Bradyrhizobium sp. RT9b]